MTMPKLPKYVLAKSLPSVISLFSSVPMKIAQSGSCLPLSCILSRPPPFPSCSAIDELNELQLLPSRPYVPRVDTPRREESLGVAVPLKYDPPPVAKASVVC